MFQELRVESVQEILVAYALVMRVLCLVIKSDYWLYSFKRVNRFSPILSSDIFPDTFLDDSSLDSLAFLA